MTHERPKLPHKRMTASLTLLVSGLLLFVSPTLFSQARTNWRFEIQEGTKDRGKVILRNACSKPHRFHLSSNAKYIGFVQPENAIAIRPGGIASIELLFDATGLESRVYRDGVTIECLDCQKDEQCGQERVEFSIEMSVIRPPGGTTREPSKSEKSNHLIETRMSNKELSRITNDERFKAALDVVEAQNEMVDMKNVRMLGSRSTPGDSEIVFNVFTKGTNEPGEYRTIVYMQQRGQGPFVFFDDREHGAGKLNINWPWKSSPPKSGSGGTGPTWPTFTCTFPAWDEWVTLETPCNNAPACILSGKGKYLTEMRKGHCSDGSIKAQTRTRFVHCQC